MKLKKNVIIITLLIGLCVGYLANRGTEIYVNSTSENTTDRLADIILYIQDDIEANPFHIYLTSKGLIGFLGGFGLVCLGVWYYLTSKKNYRADQEHGSSRFAAPEENKPFQNKNYLKNILLTATERKSILPLKDFRYNLNNNILVIGGSGSGKTYTYVTPNLLQMYGNYVVTDPKGTIIDNVGHLFEKEGYTIRVLNLVNPQKSNKYNPFAYIKEEKDIETFVSAFIFNTDNEGTSKGEDFWLKSEMLLYNAIIGYMFYELPIGERNFRTMNKIISKIKVSEENENYKNSVDVMFERLEKEKPEHFAVKQWKKFKQSSGKTAKSILISCSARMTKLDFSYVDELTKYDELDIEKFCTDKIILFVITSDTDKSNNYMAAILYTQIFNTLCRKADTEYNGCLDIPVHCLLDEFANIRIADMETLITTIRSRNIGASIIVQNFQQMKAKYKEQAGTISGNCDTLLFLGSGEEETCKMISERLGDETVYHRGLSESKGQSGSFSVSQQIVARKLMTPAEVSLLPQDQCLLFIRTANPFKSKKYPTKSHQRYKDTYSANKKNKFDLKEYMEKFEPTETFRKDDVGVLYDFSRSELDDMIAAAKEG